jgi:hypothetical protein
MTEWKLVPVEPTGKQIDDAMAACSKLTPLNVHSVYRAMLAASPPAPSAAPPPAAPTGEEEVTRLVRWLTAPLAKGAK